VLERAELSWQLDRRGPVSCTVYDAAGLRVARLVDEVQYAGRHSVTWDASGAAPGIYFAELNAGGSASAVRMVKAR
jgi:hypothetical protein